MAVLQPEKRLHWGKLLNLIYYNRIFREKQFLVVLVVDRYHWILIKISIDRGQKDRAHAWNSIRGEINPPLNLNWELLDAA